MIPISKKSVKMAKPHKRKYLCRSLSFTELIYIIKEIKLWNPNVYQPLLSGIN